MHKATIGLRAKTGRAIGVALGGTVAAPQLIERREVATYDPEIPDSGQPYHFVMEMPWPEAQIAVKDLVAVVERSASRSLEAWIRDLRANGIEVKGVGIVGAPERTLERIGNLHIRAHAAEGVLFRHALEVAAKHCKIPYRTVAEKSLVDELHELDEVLRAMGRAAGPPWRADERAAAAMAMLAMVAMVGVTSGNTTKF